MQPDHARIALLARLVLATALVFLSASAAQAQEAKDADAAGSIPRMPNGRPDLSGNYDIATLTPFTRSPAFADQKVLSSEQAQQIEQSTAAAMAFADQDSDPNREAPPPGGDGSPGAAGKVGGYNAFWVDPGSSMFKIDGQYRTSVIVDPPNGQLPELSEAGKARRAAIRPYTFENTGTAWWLDQESGPYDNPETLPLIERCIYLTVTTVPMRSVLYNNLKTIRQTDDHVMILVEWMHWARIIRLNSEHPPDDIRSLGGDSIGWWEGDTLVVETTNFLDTPNEPREGLRITERFTRKNQNELLYEFTVNDPDYVAPYSGQQMWPQTEDKLYEYACHEGNYAMGGILRGARLLEKEEFERRAREESRD